MAVSNTTSRVQYTLSTTTQTLAVPFYFIADSHLKVYKANAGATPTVLTFGTNYTVSGAGVEAGGSITLTGTGVAVADKITIRRVVPITQLVDYIPNDRFPANTHEEALDKLTMVAQMLAEEGTRTLRFEEGEVLDGLMTLALRKGKGISFDATTGELEFYDVQDVLDAATEAAASEAAAAASAAAAAGGAGIWVEKSANFTAANDGYFRATASLTITNPTPSQGKGYFVDVRNGTTTFPGGSTFPAPQLVRASYHSGAWAYRATAEVADLPLLNVRLYGAKGDGTTDDTAAFNAALAAGSIFVPYSASSYVISDELLVPSNRTALHAEGVVLFRKNNTIASGECCFYRNADYSGGNSNIRILGGTFDCNSDGHGARQNTGVYMGGVGFRFIKTTNLELGFLEVQDSQGFHIQMGDTVRTWVHDVKIWASSTDRANGDGVHFNGPAYDFVCERVTGRSNDDFVSLDCDSGLDLTGTTQAFYSVTTGDIKRGVIRDCSYSSGYGYANYNKSKVMEDVTWERCTGTPTGSAVNQYGLRIASYPNDGAAHSGMFRRITLDRVCLPQSIWIEAGAICEDIKILRCSIENDVGTGSDNRQRLKLYGTVTGLLMEGCELKTPSGATTTTATQSLIENRGTAKYVTMRSCIFRNTNFHDTNKYGVGFFNNASSIENLTIEDCVFENLYAGFLQLKGSGNPSVKNLSYRNNIHVLCGDGVRINGGTSCFNDLEITGNIFTNEGRAGTQMTNGLYIAAAASTVAVGTGVTMSDNTFNNVYSGIFTTTGGTSLAVSNIVFSNNRFVSGRFGIRLSNGTITKLMMHGNDFGTLDATAGVALEVTSACVLDQVIATGNTQNDGAAFLSFSNTGTAFTVMTVANRVESLSVASGLYLAASVVCRFSGTDLVLSRAGANGVASLSPVNGNVVNDSAKGVSTYVSGAWVPV